MSPRHREAVDQPFGLISEKHNFCKLLEVSVLRDGPQSS